MGSTLLLEGATRKEARATWDPDSGNPAFRLDIRPICSLEPQRWWPRQPRPPAMAVESSCRRSRGSLRDHFGFG
jgi:hypothetical protein